MAELTFRDFAMAVMGNQPETAATQLAELLGINAEQATVATAFFKTQMADPAFMGKAMGLRTAVTSGSDAEISAILGECFGLDAAQLGAAVAAVRTRYPRPA